MRRLAFIALLFILVLQAPEAEAYSPPTQQYSLGVEASAGALLAAGVPLAMYTNILFHELGHAIFCLLLGADIKSVTLYPHVDRGVFTLAGLHFHARTAEWTIPIIAFSGPAFSMWASVIAAEQLIHEEDKVYQFYLHSMAIYGAIHYPTYIMMDMFNDWGDPYLIEKWGGIPMYVQLIPALAGSYFLIKNYQRAYRIRHEIDEEEKEDEDEQEMVGLPHVSSWRVEGAQIALPVPIGASASLPYLYFNPLNERIGMGYYWRL